MAKETMAEIVTKHMVNGITDTDELIRLIGQDLGDIPSKRVVQSYRSKFKKHGAGWYEIEKEDAKRRYKANPEAAKEAVYRWYKANPAMTLLKACRKSAKKRGHECSLTVEDIEGLLEPMVCSVTGLALSWDDKAESDKCRWFAPSLDRIDNSIGYVLGNVRLTCWGYNYMRGDLPDQVLLTIMKAAVGSIHH